MPVDATALAGAGEWVWRVGGLRLAMTTFPLASRTVHRVGFGAMQPPGPGVFGPPRDHDEAVRVLCRAVELGVDHIDTAQYYGPRVANELSRRCTRSRRTSPWSARSAASAARPASGRWAWRRMSC